MSAISVVIPTCNTRPDFLEAAIRCGEGQTLPAHEIIVVDNGPEPPSLGAHAGVRGVRIPQYSGPAQARNFGAGLVTGEYVAFLDDDDLWGNRYLEKVSELIRSQRPDCLTTRLDKLVDGESEPYKCSEGHLGLDEQLVRNPGSSGSSTVIRREAFFEAAGYDPRLTTGEDKGLVISLLLAGSKVVGSSEIQAILRQHDDNRLRDRRDQGVLDFVRIFGPHMSARQRHHNLAKAYRLRFQNHGRRTDQWRARYHRTLRGLASLVGSR